MSYEVLARKWRPRSFAELVGQEHVVRALVNALDHNRLHHAFLFTGTRGVGKTTIARILAKSLNCEQGVSAQPCGECATCQEVDSGRFVDLIEVDAASRTKVDDTRELLDNVQYAPTRGRYKVYLIDEVHMLSGHSFNALLKTLEEPPPHVKFLLATTDPQKLPVTVLSRCLQFSLKRLGIEQIQTQLQKILQAEGMDADSASLSLLARAADGSMRDALSLLDQALAFGGGQLAEADVRAMLGSIDQNSIERILQALADRDAAALLTVAADCHAHGMDEQALLDELLLALHYISLLQIDAGLLHAEVQGREMLTQQAQHLPPEDVQLFYQIALHGKRDLPLAPDPRTGLEMALVRMHAFRPVEQTHSTSQGPAPVTVKGIASAHTAAQSKSDSAKPVEAAASEQVTADPTTVAPAQDVAPATVAPATLSEPVTAVVDDEAGRWAEIVAGLQIGGLLQQLAQHTVLQAHEGKRMSLVLDQAYAQLYSKEREAELKAALEKYFAASSESGVCDRYTTDGDAGTCPDTQGG